MSQNQEAPQNLTAEQRALVALRRMKAHVESLEREKNEPIAIVGMGCRFPGGANSPEAFWELLAAGVDAITEVPADRWDVHSYYDPDANAPGKMSTRWGGWISGVDQFDPYFFGISPREAAGMDPQRRIWLEVAWEALEDAGQTFEGLSGSQTGVFAGVYNADYSLLQMAQPELVDTYSASGNVHSLVANHLSYLLDLRGPSMAIDTACSSSLFAVHAACQSLRRRECNLAVAGGVNLILSPWSSVAVSKVLAMAADGRCKTFDARADGIVRGEGCGAIVLKRLSDAQADGDRILALIRGSAVNQDGRSAGLTAPNVLAQKSVVLRALANAGVAADDISYIEAHGTGTTLGDPIEIEALAGAMAQTGKTAPPCIVGSVKTNFGHLEAAAGIAGLIKTVLAMRHRTIPRHLHFRALNPNISLDGTRFTIPVHSMPWEAERRIAGVSSFGIGGANAHIVLEEAPALAVQPLADARAQILPLSARSAEALQDLASAYRERIAAVAASLAGICFNAGIRRSHHSHRGFVVGRTREEILQGLDSLHTGVKSPGARPGLAFVFSGQGANWAGVGRQLLAEEPLFRAAVEQCDALLRAHAGWSILEELNGDRLHNTEFAQPVLFAIQVGICAVLKSWGVEPDAVTGHSLGEVAAAHVAGVLSLEDAIQVVYHRSRLMQRTHGQGAMLAVALSAAAAGRFSNGLAVAAENGASSIVLAGSPEAVEEAAALLTQEGVRHRSLPVAYAFHSPQMDALRGELEQALHAIRPQPSRIPIASTVTGKTLPGEAVDGAYWARNLRDRVRFADAVQTLLRDGPAVFIEIGPHPMLTADLPNCRPTLRRGRDERAALLESLGGLYIEGFPVDWRKVYPVRGEFVPLPSYPWQHARYWIEGAEPVRANGLYSMAWQPEPRATEGNASGKQWRVIGDAELAARLEPHCVPDGLRNIVYRGPLNAELLKLAQNLDGGRLWLVTQGALDQDPEQALLWGFGRSFAHEHPELWGGLIDGASGEIEEELLNSDGAKEIWFNGGERFSPHLVEASPRSPQQPWTPRADATYLITGGLGALGKRLAQELAASGARHIVLIGRSGGTALEIPGATVVAADVSREDNVARVLDYIDRHLPPLRGVFHAAGILDDGIVLRQDWARFETVLAPKVAGARNLHKLTANLPLDCFVLFSSAAAMLGSPGQANYAAANSYLDTLAHSRRSQGLPALSVNWGPWAGGGMASGAGAESRFGTIAPADGMRMLRELMTEGATVAAVLPPRLAELARRAQEPKSTARAEHLPVPMIVREQVIRVLKFDPSRSLDTRQPLNELGLDSLMAVELRNALASALGRDLPATLVFDYPTIDALTGFLAGETASAPAAIEVCANTAEPIAIIGMACRFPGGVNDPESFWQLLRDGVDAVGDTPLDRWNVDDYFDPDPEKPGKMYTRSGAYLDGIDQFDPQFFGIAPRETISMDPQQRLLLEVSWEALERAGQASHRLAGTQTGVFIGLGSNEYGQLQLRNGEIDPYWGTGNTASIAAGRISYTLGLRGPAMAVDTACSSSLVAVHLAAQALRSGECSLALAGGVNLMLSPEANVYLSRIRALSPHGQCRTFDAAADGYVRGEGCGIVVLKRWSEAQAAGDPILAVLRGSAVNHDGRSSGLTAPNGPAQQAVIQAAIAQAGVDPSAIHYVETHGTGTPLGDPIEVQALAAVLGQGRKSPLQIGSVKTNIGHLEPAAGIASLIKVVLALQHREVPAHLHFETPNPHIAWNELPISVPTATMPWEGTLLAGVSSFGLSGTNAHAIIEGVQPSPKKPPQQTPDTPETFLLPLSARTPAALQQLVNAYAKVLPHHWPADLCYTASVRRAHHEFRYAALVPGSVASVEEPTAARARRIVFVFSGQGAQWNGMTDDLLATEPVFRAAMERCDASLKPHLSRSIFDAEGLAAENLQATEIAQPLIFALQIALAELWQSWGIAPAAVIGHSVGEIAAACLAGILSLEDGARLAACRGALMQQTHGSGAMVSVDAPIAAPPADLEIAAINAPNVTVFSGTPDRVAAAIVRFQSEGIACRLLDIPYAFHSCQMESIEGSLLRSLTGLQPQAGSIPMISTLTGAPVQAEELTAAYWARQMRNAVRFSDAMRALLHDSYDVFLELGPHATLSKPMSDCVEAAGRSAAVLSSLRRGRSGREMMLGSLGRLYTLGCDVQWEALYPRGGRCVSLPAYPWQKQRYWIEDSPGPSAPGHWQNWLCEIEWRPQPLTAPRPVVRDGWLVFAAQDPPGAPLAAALKATLVTPQQGLPTLTDTRGVIHFGPLTSQLLKLVQALADLPHPPRLWLITDGSLEQAPVAGFARVIAAEHPALRCVTIEIDSGALIDQILAELGADGLENQVALRHGERLVARLIKLAAPSGPAVVRSDATYLITGGLGSLGLEVARWLAARGAARLVLIGRHAASAPEIAGTEIIVKAVDISESDQVNRLIDELRDSALPLRGIVHAAGTLRDGVLRDQTWEDFEAVLAPKSQGAWNLHQATRDLPLDFFVLFSSAAAIFGAPGQANYAAANASLDHLANLRRQQGLPAVSINWGPWAGSGMAAGLTGDAARAAQRRWSNLGFSLIPPREGLAAFEAALATDRAQLAVTPIAWNTLLASFPEGLEPSLLADFTREFRGDRTPSAAEPDFARKLRAAAPVTRKSMLLAFLRQQAMRVLGLDAEQGIDPEKPLTELGLDSLMAVELRNTVNANLGRSLPATLLFDYPTLDKLAARLSAEFAPEDAAAAAAIASATQAHDRAEPIAIIGMACRFPGGVDDAESFWELLHDGVDAVTEVPPERWNIDDLYDPDPEAPGKMSTRWGGFLKDVDRFDPQFFGISPREAVAMDPQQRLLLEICWEALEQGGQAVDRLSGTQAGVFVGICANEYAAFMGSAGIDPYWATGNAASVAAGRISYALGLQGPSMAIDTACSSAVVAIHLACQSLRANECSLALAGGINLILGPEAAICFSKMHAMAADGRCKTFDSAADGFVRSEGCGVVALKRLSDAVADGDPIWAVIRGSAVNQDGRSAGITAPNGPSQESVVRAALRQAGVLPSEIEYVEAHGTGTPLGDPIELQALDAVLGEGRAKDQPLIVGSVKTNIGHTEGAAGIAGVLKTVLALQHQQIPPHLHFHSMNPHITLHNLSLVVPTHAEPWPIGTRPRLAGVSSFGFSGTNGHVVIEEAPARPARTPAPHGSYVLPLSARSPEALQALASQYQDWLGQDSTAALSDICYTASVRRSHHPHRLAVAADSVEQLAQQLASAKIRSLAPGQSTPVVFIFPGHGGQWSGMGRELLAQEPIFRAAVERCADAMRPFLSWPLMDALTGAAPVEPIEVVQPASFAFQAGLAALWESWGVRPAAVIGHSMGEITAAYVAGALSLENACRMIAIRGQILARIGGLGRMAMVELPVSDVEPLIAPYDGRISIGGINSPRSVALSGATDALEDLQRTLSERDVFFRWIKIGYAAHSTQVDAVVDEFRQALANLAPRETTTPFHSTVTGEIVAGSQLDADYWGRNLRQPVRFWPAVRSISAENAGVFLELSPHPTLAVSLQECLRAITSSAEVLAPLHRDQPAPAALRHGLAALYTFGAAIDWAGLYPHGGECVPLPKYPWQRERFWVDTTKRVSTVATSRRGSLLLERGWQSSDSDTWFWETELSAASASWLADHRVEGSIVLPGTAYIETALAAAQDAYGPGRRSVEDLTLQQALIIPQDGALTVQVALGLDQPGAARFRCQSRAPGLPWTLHAAATVRMESTTEQPPALDIDALNAVCPEVLDGDKLYQAVAQHGLKYGPAFQGVHQVRWADGTTIASLNSGSRPVAATLDSAAQTFGLATGQREGIFLPVGVRSASIFGDLKQARWAHTELRGHNQGDVLIADETGAVLAGLFGLRVQEVASDRRQDSDSIRNWFYALDWIAQEVPSEAPAQGRWLLFGDPDSILGDLSQQLTSRGATCVHDSAFDPSAPCRAVVVICSGSGEVPEDAVSATLEVFHRARALVEAGYRDAPRLYIVTTAGVAHTAVWGLGRTIAMEHPELRCTLIEVDTSSPNAVLELAAELTADSAETQIRLTGGIRQAARLARWTEPPAELRTAPAGDRPFRLEIDHQGVLDDLTLREFERRTPGPGEVEIAVAAAALNFNDVLKAMGLYPGLPPGLVPLGSECAGTVVAVGPGVDHLRVGDEVAAIAANCFATHITTSAEIVARKPADLSMEQTAALPIVWGTVLYALRDLGRLSAGETILIHAAAGGVGLAAIEYAHRVGARVFATAGSPEKRALLESMGVEHVMNSRSLEFAQQIATLTQGRGVDVVLNSLPGEAMLKSLELVAPFGRFLELGKRDLYENRQIGLWPLRKGVAYIPVDLAGLAIEKPAQFSALFREALQQPPIPCQSFPIASAVDAFRFMGQGKHTGKLVLTTEHRASTAIQAAPFSIRAHATYLITGGLGALGLVVAEWLVDKGARHLVLIGRSEPSAEAHAAISKLTAAGCSVTVKAADAANRQQMERVFGDIDSGMPPLRGILHAAGVLDDGILLRLDDGRFRKVMAPKVDGAWNLHELSAHRPLDFFVLFSSAAGFLGAPGQANYAAGNAFLDGLAHHRHSLGLSALSVDWGPWSEVGLAARPDRGGRMSLRGVESIQPRQGMQALDRLLHSGAAQAAVLGLSTRQWSEYYPGAAGSPLFSQVLREDESAAQSKAESAIALELRAAAAGQRQALLEQHLKEQLGQVLRLDAARIDRLAPLSTLGIDSLMALELRNRLETSLGVTLSATLIWNYPTVAVLAPFLASKMGLDLATPSPADEGPGDDLLAILGEAGKLSEDELRGMVAGGD